MDKCINDSVHNYLPVVVEQKTVVTEDEKVVTTAVTKYEKFCTQCGATC